MKRRDFIQNLSLSLGAFSLAQSNLFAQTNSPWFEISLAEWSVHKQIFSNQLDNLDFPAKAKNEFGITIVEYVNTLFRSKTNDFKTNGASDTYLKELLKRTQDLGVRNNLIMCDAEGSLGEADPQKRKQTVENHHKWVAAAAFLGCKTIRVNAGGSGTAEEVAKNAADGLHQLGEYAAKSNINVIVENHGGYSSNGKWLSGVISSVNLPNVGTLPDLGNFCITRSKADWTECLEAYDRYEGTKELMPYAKGVSAKTNNFLPNGKEVNINYDKLMKIIKDAGFNGIIGIEYEGDYYAEDEGIKLTKKLLEMYL